ncbi:hypothetical protein Ais01nite_11600 [Asanoa ishikariensis]|uniref:Lipase (Class 2) n=1 Tax=Asanoa ishikariensis TaxID=137265 RepID=A0A1H3T2S3_9ACTN|nr:hypothetical protein Ais01nite_11600 [Asanoa ishikariensis]SDZ44131.1 Lipase (class 2) [Asanoa ishikariensis]
MGYDNDGRLPLIYVRGFAGSGIDKAVEDPFYGFNEGSVHVRVDGFGDPQFYQFESPMLRLMIDENYRLLVHGDQRAFLQHSGDGEVDANTLWIHRFYDVSASTFSKRPTEFSIENAAADLFDLIELVRRKTGAPKVFLVAHSMGGLICRSVIQRHIPLLSGKATDYIARLFTYGTPHGGIEFDVGFGLIEKLRDLTGISGADIFGPGRMYEYLTPALPGAPSEDDFDAQVMPPDGFPVDEVFCLVGTNPADYQVALGLSSKLVGARSDGLVQVDNAYVEGANRAMVHRSHSGTFGIVNSEEGYQNLRRFLFGDLMVRVDLVGLSLPDDPDDDVVWQLETQLSIRGLPVLMHTQTAAQYCPVQLERTSAQDSTDAPFPLVTTFLSSKLAPRRDGQPRAARHFLKLRLISLRVRDGVFDFLDHMEQAEDWQDLLLVDIAPDPAGTSSAPLRCWATWNRTVTKAIRSWEPQPSDLLEDANTTAGVWRGEIQMPPEVRELLGENARLSITVTPRSAAG